jgi:hypothetical protein
MAAESKSKGKDPAAPKAKPASPEDQAKPKQKKAKPAETKETKEAAPQEKAPPPKPKAPADPRLKLLKKFAGKFLPKGPLRERYKALMARWNSGEDHGGVTVAELCALLDDWRATRAKPARATKT